MSTAPWPEVRSRFIYSQRDIRGADAPLASATKEGVFLRDDLETSVWNPASDVSNYKLVEPDDFVIGLRSFQHGIAHSVVRGLVSPAYTVLHGNTRTFPGYYKYYFRSLVFVSQLANLTQGIRQGQAIDIKAFADLELPVPPLEDQRRIASFLDAETIEIGLLTTARRTQISALSELELAQIGAALSGSDVVGDRTATGWGWLASIPSHWRIGPVYAYFDVDLGKMLNAERTAGDDMKPYLRNANVHWYEISTDDMAMMTFGPDERRRYRIKSGDLLVCEGGAGVAEAAVWDGRMSECYYQKSLHRVRARKEAPVKWLMYWLRYAKAAGVFDAEGNLSTIPHLTGEQLAEYRVPIPPDGSERIRKLDSQIAVIRQLQADLTSANALLAERRQALITAAVTGQIDVTTARGIAG